jgi:hypothetical protein
MRFSPAAVFRRIYPLQLTGQSALVPLSRNEFDARSLYDLSLVARALTLAMSDFVLAK